MYEIIDSEKVIGACESLSEATMKEQQAHRNSGYGDAQPCPVNIKITQHITQHKT